MRKFIATIAILAPLFSCAGPHAAFAEVKTGAWSNVSKEQRAWLGRQCQNGFPQCDQWHSCCGKGDAVVVEITGGDDYWVTMIVIDGKGHIENGRELRAERSKIHQDRDDPSDFPYTIAWVSKDGKTIWCVTPSAMF